MSALIMWGAMIAVVVGDDGDGGGGERRRGEGCG